MADIFSRIGSICAEFSALVRHQIDADVRRDWGGERCYIAKLGESGRAQRTERDARIRAEHRRGEHEALLARRYAISIKRVRQIVAG